MSIIEDFNRQKAFIYGLGLDIDCILISKDKANSFFRSLYNTDLVGGAFPDKMFNITVYKTDTEGVFKLIPKYEHSTNKER